MPSETQVLLTEDVDHLGYRGDVVEVKAGYWRNYLRPQKKATAVTKGMLHDLQERMERRRAAEARNSEEATELREMIARTSITIGALASADGKLYGSVGTTEIVKTLESVRRMKIDAKKVLLDQPIKTVGEHAVAIHLFEGIRAELTVTVEGREAASEEEEQASEESAEKAQAEESNDDAEAADASDEPKSEGEDAPAEEDASGEADADSQ